VVIKNDVYVKGARIKALKREIAKHQSQLLTFGQTIYANHHNQAILRFQKELDALLAS